MDEVHEERWPSLRLADWEPTYLTLHRWLQIVGKIRLALAPHANHWWHVPLYVTTEGLTTSPMPIEAGALTIRFDFRAHLLVADTSDGASAMVPLEPMTVQDFYTHTMGALRKLGIEPPRIWPVPVEVADRTRLDRDRVHRSYDEEAVARLHRVLVSVDSVFERFRGCFCGKSSPVHLFWGAFDLAVTRFSGRRNPNPPDDPVMRQAYSHEVISHGFWPGGDWPGAGRVEDALFYAYAVPEPEGFAQARVEPARAGYDPRLHEFTLAYEDVRRARDPDDELFRFMESTYSAGARLAGWPIESLDDRTVARVRTAREVFEDHLALARSGKVEEDLTRNYDAKCTVFAKGRVLHGHDGVRELASELSRELPRGAYCYDTTLVDEDVCFLEWSADDDHASVHDGADTFVVRDGKVVTQTIHYTVVPK